MSPLRVESSTGPLDGSPRVANGLRLRDGFIAHIDDPRSAAYAMGVAARAASNVLREEP